MNEVPPDRDRVPVEPETGLTRPVPGPAAPPPAPVPEREKGRGRLVALAWFLSSLGAVLGLALVLWPYGRACGLELTFYLGAAALTGLVGAAGAIASWHSRRGLAHTLSLLIVIWAVIVIAREVLPRVGYTRVERAWLCP